MSDVERVSSDVVNAVEHRRVVADRTRLDDKHTGNGSEKSTDGRRSIKVSGWRMDVSERSGVSVDVARLDVPVSGRRK